MLKENQWTVVYESENEIDIQVVKAKLESYSIQTRVTFESLSRLCGFTTGPLATTRILVPASDKEDAVQIIDSWDDEL